jgi:hypothetical protein
MLTSTFLGLALIVLCLRRGAVKQRYGAWTRYAI